MQLQSNRELPMNRREGKGNRGRPRQTYIQQAKNKLGVVLYNMDKINNMAQEREDWRLLRQLPRP